MSSKRVVVHLAICRGSLEMGVGLVFFVWDVGAERSMFLVIHFQDKASKYLLLKVVSRIFALRVVFS